MSSNTSQGNSDSVFILVYGNGRHKLYIFVNLIFLFRAEVEAYKALDPGVRVVILKALCDIRVEVPVIKYILLKSRNACLKA